MKVNAYKTVDVECEVEVGLEDCINEMIGMSEEEGLPSRKLQALDGATKVLEKITPEMVAAKLHPMAVDILFHRLKKWIEVLIKGSEYDITNSAPRQGRRPGPGTAQPSQPRQASKTEKADGLDG